MGIPDTDEKRLLISNYKIICGMDVSDEISPVDGHHLSAAISELGGSYRSGRHLRGLCG